MNYEELCQRLSNIYDAGEAKALVRWVLDVRFGLTMADIYCGKVTQLSANDQAELEKIMQRLEKAEPVQYVLGVLVPKRSNCAILSLITAVVISWILVRVVDVLP